MEYQKHEGTKGAWLEKKIELNERTAVLVTEVKPETSNFKNKDGTSKTQDVGKIKVGDDEPVNFAVNKPTVNALIDAFGTDSKKWVNEPLKIVAEKVVVNGKRGVSVYLVPEGYELGEDDGGYIIITKKNGDDDKIEYPEEE